MAEGPAIEALLRRLAETPAEFLAEPRIAGNGAVTVDAVVFDVLADLGHRMSDGELREFRDRKPAERNWLRMVLIGAWLVHDDAFCGIGAGPKVLRWFLERLRKLALLVDAEQFVADADRREEMSRILLDATNLTPAGESAKQASDRLSTVDSVERARILAETRAQRERAEQLRKEMEAQRAREAAARYSRE